MRPPLVRDEPSRGRKVLFQIVVAALVLMLGLAGLAGEYAAKHSRVLDEHRRGRAAKLLRETVESFDAYSFDHVSTLDGAAVHESGTPERSDYKVEIAVIPSGTGLLQIKAILRDSTTLQRITETVTYRGRY